MHLANQMFAWVKIRPPLFSSVTMQPIKVTMRPLNARCRVLLLCGADPEGHHQQVPAASGPTSEIRAWLGLPWLAH